MLARALSVTLTDSILIKLLTSGYGMREGVFARRFIAGETLKEAMAISARISQEGIRSRPPRTGTVRHTTKLVSTLHSLRLCSVSTSRRSPAQRNLTHCQSQTPPSHSSNPRVSHGT